MALCFWYDASMDGTRNIADTLYECDFAAWSMEQARALRAGAYDTVDWENVIEEIETLGRAERSALRSAIGLILEHRIKLDHGLNDDPKAGWKRAVKAQQIHARKRLQESPSLKPEVSALMEDEYSDARDLALASFELHEGSRLDHYRESIPTTCPYSEAELLG